jgi:hypothetical protein
VWRASLLAINITASTLLKALCTRWRLDPTKRQFLAPEVELQFEEAECPTRVGGLDAELARRERVRIAFATALDSLTKCGMINLTYTNGMCMINVTRRALEQFRAGRLRVSTKPTRRVRDPLGLEKRLIAAFANNSDLLGATERKLAAETGIPRASIQGVIRRILTRPASDSGREIIECHRATRKGVLPRAPGSRLTERDRRRLDEVRGRSSAED